MNKDEINSLLKHKVVVTSNNCSQSGYLVCLDPVTLTIVLYDDAQQSLSMIFHHAIISINKVEEQTPNHNIDFKQICDDFFGITSAIPKYTALEQQQRRTRVLNLLKENNVPVEEQDDLLIAAYSVCINPPYTLSDCKSSNALVLCRIQNILREES